MKKKILISILVLLLLAVAVSASLTAPGTYSVGYKIWGKYWDMMGENGVRNGTIGGVGNNVTLLDSAGNTLVSNATMYNATVNNIYTIINVTANYTIGTGNASGSFYNVSANLGTVNITLPAMNSVALGTFYNVNKADVSSNQVDINVTGNCCINGAAWANMTAQYQSITITNLMSEWRIT